MKIIKARSSHKSVQIQVWSSSIMAFYCVKLFLFCFLILAVSEMKHSEAWWSAEELNDSVGDGEKVILSFIIAET